MALYHHIAISKVASHWQVPITILSLSPVTSVYTNDMTKLYGDRAVIRCRELTFDICEVE